MGPCWRQKHYSDFSIGQPGIVMTQADSRGAYYLDLCDALGCHHRSSITLRAPAGPHRTAENDGGAARFGQFSSSLHVKHFAPRARARFRLCGRLTRDACCTDEVVSRAVRSRCLSVACIGRCLCNRPCVWASCRLMRLRAWVRAWVRGCPFPMWGFTRGLRGMTTSGMWIDGKVWEKEEYWKSGRVPGDIGEARCQRHANVHRLGVGPQAS